MTDKYEDVHTEHCCALHGCKYNDDCCPVVQGVKLQSWCCETCMMDGKSLLDARRRALDVANQRTRACVEAAIRESGAQPHFCDVKEGVDVVLLNAASLVEDIVALMRSKPEEKS